MRNHYVPQFLQRPWTSEHDGALQVFHVNETGVHSTRKPPKRTGYRDDMLALTRDTIGQRNKHEIEQVVLQQVDNDAALVRVKLHNGQLQALTHEERCAWVRFIMSLRIRDPAVVRDLVTQSDQELRRSLAENLNEYVQLADGDDPASLEEWTELKFPGLIENFGLTFYHDLLNDGKVGNKLLRLKWWVFDLSGASNLLLLGDRPCIFFEGIDNPNLSIALPISPNKVFIATRGEMLAKGLPRISPSALVMRINQATVAQASYYIYARDNRSLRFVVNRRSGKLTS